MKTYNSTVANIIRDLDWLTNYGAPTNEILHTMLDHISRWANTFSDWIDESDAPVLDILELATHATDSASWESVALVQGYAQDVFCKVFMIEDPSDFNKED